MVRRDNLTDSNTHTKKNRANITTYRDSMSSNMKVKCIQCGTEFEAVRATAKFCSNKCKLAFHSVSENLSVSPKEELSVSKVAASGSATQGSGFATDSQYDSVMKLYDTFSASELVAAGVRPPKWKKRFKTHGEALMSCRNVLKKEFDIEYEIKEVDYTTWK